MRTVIGQTIAGWRIAASDRATATSLLLPELHMPNVAAQPRIVSATKIYRAFKGIIC